MKIVIFAITLVFSTSVVKALDYYWIGGSGNWADLNHWVTTSGGTVQHDQIPTSADDVIFDANSFTAPNQIINLNLDFIFCRNLDFRGITETVQIAGQATSVFSIYGSLYMHQDVTLNFRGSFDFKSDEIDNELHWSGQRPFRLNFVGSGSWRIATDLQVDSLIHIEFGSLIFDPVDVTCERFEVFSQSRVGLDFGSSNLLITGSRILEMPSYRWKESLHLQGGQIEVTPGNSTITLTSSKASIGFYDISQVKLDNVEFGVSGGEHLIYANWVGNFEFKRLHLLGNTYLEGSFNIRELELDGGNVYTMQSNSQQKIGSLMGNTDCGSTVFLKASEGGQPVNLLATAGAQSLDFVMIQDMQVQGATYVATNAIDLGGNSGWNIQLKNMDVFYWIGGTGNWNDINHWSFTSGGAPSGCLPTAADDVIFDQNSFTAANQEVVINIQNAFCHSFDWRLVNQTCRLANVMLPNKSSIHVFGSLWFSPLLTNDFQGDFLFESAHDGNELLTLGKEFNLNVSFNSALGQWRLRDKLNVRDTILFNAGILFSDNQEIECFHLLSETSAFRELHLGSSLVRIVMTSAHPYYWSRIGFNATNLTIFPGTSLIKCENSTTVNTYSPGVVDFFEIIFEGFGGLNNDNGKTTQLNIAKMIFLTDGDFRNEFNIDTLIFSPGWKYTMFMNTVLYVDSLSAHGHCDGAIYFASYPKGIQTRVNKKSGLLRASDVMLEGVVGEGGAIFEAQASVDLGLNSGWTFTPRTARTLYWVGNEGLWHDRQNWSLVSGGPGGECVPTAIDDVIFDANSFTAAWQGVGLMGARSPICHDMTWENVPDFVRIEDGELYLTGSLTLEANLTFQPWNLIFTSDSLENEITTSGNDIAWVDFMGKGCWALMDDLNAVYQINLQGGTLKTNSQMVTTGRIFMGNYPVDFERELILDSSYILLNPMPTSDDQLFITSNNFEIDPGESLVEFNGDDARSRMYGSGTLLLNNVLFSNIQGNSTIEQWDASGFRFKRLQINNNGTIYGNNEMDSLYLAAGKEYTLESGRVQRVNAYLNAIGNNCTPISLQSTQPGLQSRMVSQSAKIVADFIQMQDQNASGGADFTVGSHSTDISNNTGWIFDPAPDHIKVGFLGADRTLCQDSAIILSAFNFSPNETYVWDDLSTGPELPVSSGGTYWAQVTFDNNCVIRDTIEVLDPLLIQVDLGSDSTLCEGELLILDGSINFPETNYTWQDGTEGPQLQVSEAGRYSVAAEVDGCFFSDSIDVDYNPLPKVAIQGATTACEGNTVSLDATLPNGQYRWQNNTTQPILQVNTDGLYWVEVEIDECIAADTVEIIFTPRPPVDLGADTILCEEEVLALNVNLADTKYLWQDSSQTDEFHIDAPGLYWVELTRASCSVRDSIVVNYNPKPVLPRLGDTALCDGTQWALSLNEPGVTYHWNTGIQGGNILIETPGNYEVLANLNGCERQSSFNVQFEPPPTVDLGPDLTLCEGEQVDFSFSEVLTEYTWQDTLISTEFSITNSGRYFVSASKLNCVSSDTLEALFNPLPEFSLGPDLHLCPGDSFHLSADNIMGTLSWHDSSTSPNFTGNQPGTYWLSMEENNCHFRDSIIVTNSEVLTINLGADTTICSDKTMILDAFHPDAISYLWQDGNNDAERMITAPGIYQVELNDGQCSFNYDIEISFRECVYLSIFVPNAFTPDNDGINDTFLPLINPAVQIDNYHFQVFNRWGSLLFSSTDPSKSWDGKFNGEDIAMDAYVYAVQFDYIDDEGSGRYEDGGSVMVIR